MTSKLQVKFYGNPKAIAVTSLILFVFVVGGLYYLDHKRKVEYYKIQFDNVDRLSEGDKIILKGLEVGEVTNFELSEDRKVLVTISIGRSIKLTKGSTFTIHSDLWGTRHIEINLADNQELIDIKEIQTGNIQPPDTTSFRELSKEERDSLIKYDPLYRLADTVMNLLRKPNDSTKATK